MESSPSFYILPTESNNANGLLFDDHSADLLSLDIYSSLHNSFQPTDPSLDTQHNQIQYNQQQSRTSQEFNLLTALDTSNVNSPGTHLTLDSHFSISQSAESNYNIQSLEHDLINLNPVYLKYDQSQQPESVYFNNPTIVEEAHEAEKLFTSNY